MIKALLIIGAILALAFVGYRHYHPGKGCVVYYDKTGSKALYKTCE